MGIFVVVLLCIYLYPLETEGYIFQFHPIEEQLRDKKVALAIFGSMDGMVSLIFVLEVLKSAKDGKGKT